jgi:hypothetical protein
MPPQVPTRAPDDDDRLNHYRDDMLACRATGHHWTHDGDEVHERNSRKRVILVKRVWRCERCPTRRIDIINVDFWYVASRSYDYPDGYRLTGGAVESGALRREMILRTSNLRDLLRR